MTLDDLIIKIKDDIKYYNNPPKYLESIDYDRYLAKGDYAEEILYLLEGIKNEN